VTTEANDQLDLFVSGTEGYHTYRIPALLITRNDTVLAFCEGRRDHGGDHGCIDLLVKRSEDNGRTWSEQQAVWSDHPNTCGNPCPVQDPATGTIWLAMNWNRPGNSSADFFRSYDGRLVFMAASDDDGRTWSQARDITADVKPRDWGWHATGPGVGIVLQRGPRAGRLLIPCNHSEVEGDPVRFGSHVITSDDHGRTWRPGGYTASVGLDECQIAELRDDRVMLNARTADVNHPWRRITFSGDGGESWGPVQDDPNLTDVTLKGMGCQGSLVRAPDGTLFFSNPASGVRERMTVRMSTDDGVTWPAARELYEGPSAYSCLACLPDGRVACLYECGRKHAYERITLAAISPGWRRSPNA
jgi:sialidase-1